MSEADVLTESKPEDVTHPQAETVELQAANVEPRTEAGEPRHEAGEPRHEAGDARGPRHEAGEPRHEAGDARGPRHETDDLRTDAEALDAEEQEEQKELDPEVKARRDAALRHVRKLGDPVLRAKALPVQRFDADLADEVKRMGELMGDALGIGLAATQIGVLHRVLVYRADPEQPITALVNPVIEWTSEETEVADEGCLSIPHVQVEVERPARVRVSGNSPDGESLQFEAEGLEARVIQHEVDHLDGVLILDRISRSARRDAMRAMREALAAEDAR